MAPRGSSLAMTGSGAATMPSRSMMPPTRTTAPAKPAETWRRSGRKALSQRTEKRESFAAGVRLCSCEIARRSLQAEIRGGLGGWHRGEGLLQGASAGANSRGTDGAGRRGGRRSPASASTADGAVEIGGEGGLDGGAGVEFHRAARSWRSRSWRCGDGYGGWALWLVGEQNLPEGGAAAGEAALDGAEVDVEDFGDLFVGEALRSRGGRRRCGRLPGPRGVRLRRERGARPGRPARTVWSGCRRGWRRGRGSSSSRRIRAMGESMVISWRLWRDHQRRWLEASRRAMR